MYHRGYTCGFFPSRKSNINSTSTFSLRVGFAGLPLGDQFGFRHYVATARLIGIGGDDFRSKLRDLKLHGIKTEPAIARILCLSGDPYQSVAALAELGDDELSRLFLQ